MKPKGRGGGYFLLIYWPHLIANIYLLLLFGIWAFFARKTRGNSGHAPPFHLHLCCGEKKSPNVRTYVGTYVGEKRAKEGVGILHTEGGTKNPPDLASGPKITNLSILRKRK